MTEHVRQLVGATVDAAATELRRIADTIWQHPELAFEERAAARLLCDYLEARGFAVERPCAGLQTAFRAAAGTGRPAVAIMCEYDALPEIGHGCGHNLIAVVGLAAGVALKATLEGEEAPEAGTVLVLGTPGEEGGGGKVILIRQGAFEGVDFALMAHPSSEDRMDTGSAAIRSIALRFHGRSAHAAAAPEKGVNALDAVILTFNGINALRQHVKEDSRIHGIVTKGGTRPNIVPDFAEAEFYVRSYDERYLGELVSRVTGIAEGAARMTGARFELVECGGSYRSRVPCPVLGRVFREEAERLGFAFVSLTDPGRASSDAGDVSWVVPALHPYFAICPPGTPAHSKEFAACAAEDTAFARAMSAAKALALTAARLMHDPGLLDEARAAFAARSVSRPGPPAPNAG